MNIIDTVLDLSDIRRTEPPDLICHNALCYVVTVTLSLKKSRTETELSKFKGQQQD